MPYRPPLVPFETFVADPPDLPVRGPGEQGLSALTRAEVLGHRRRRRHVQGHHVRRRRRWSSQVGAAGEGVLRVRLSERPDARSRSARPRSRWCARAAIRRDGRGRPTGPCGSAPAPSSRRSPSIRGTCASSTPPGRVLLEQDRGERDISGRLRTLPFGRSLADGAVVAYHESFTAPADERFVGLGEKFTRLDKRGQRALMWNFDAFGSGVRPLAQERAVLPVQPRATACSSTAACRSSSTCASRRTAACRSWCPTTSSTTTCSPGRRRPTSSTGTTRSPAAPLLPPKWAFGTWISSGFFVDTPGARAGPGAEASARRGIPCDVLHLDCYWQVAGHWSDLRWDASTSPTRTAMLADLAEQGFRVCLWINPYVSHLSPAFAEPPRPATSCAGRRRDVRRRRLARLATRPAASSTSPTRGAVAWFTRTCCGRCCGRASRCSRPTSPRACRPTRWRTTG